MLDHTVPRGVRCRCAGCGHGRRHFYFSKGVDKEGCQAKSLILFYFCSHLGSPGEGQSVPAEAYHGAARWVNRTSNVPTVMA
jgi:hypothetical protein